MIKKCILFMMLFITLPAFAYFEPEWSEFCPYNYRNIDVNKNYIAPIKKYWQQRRITFEKNLAYCKTLKDSNACFQELRKIENEKTEIAQKNMLNSAIIISN